MTKFFNYYNSLCVGINTPNVFTFDPYFSAVKELFTSEIKQMIYYIEKLKELDIDMTEYRDKIIDFISIIIANLDFSRENFFIIVEDLYKNKKNIKEKYIETCKNKNIKITLLEEETDISDKEKIIKLLNKYEQNKINKNEISDNKKSLFAIITTLILNACNCIAELKEYDYNYNEAKDEILKIFNISTFNIEKEDDIKKEIENFSRCNYKITKKLYKKISEKFGVIKEKEVEFKTKEGKGILVSGNNLNELKKILDSTKNTEINIYTHDEMINAYKYTNFEEYKNLIGQYQNDNNTFSIDFATFPGAIYISKNSLPQIDIIRGQIYTNAKNPTFGIGKISKDDFSELIEYSQNQKGFLLDTTTKSIKIGYNQNELIEKIKKIIEKIKNNEIENIVIIGHFDKTNNKTENEKKIIEKISKKDYIIYFGYNEERDNLWQTNNFFDFEIVYQIIEELKNNINNVTDRIKIIMTDCNNSTISNIFNLRELGIKDIYLGYCCPNIINPTIIDGLKNMFNIKELNEL